MLNFNKSQLERYVPALRSASVEVSERVNSLFLPAQRRVASALGFALFDTLAEIVGGERLAELVYNEAALQSVASLDLVATATGFGVVSNQNVAPASAHRVENLKEALRIRTSELRDDLLVELIQVEELPRGFIQSLFFCPSVCRAYGLTTAGGELVYDREFLALVNPIRKAEEALAKIISPELWSELVRRLSRPELNDTYHEATQMARYAVVAMIKGETARPDLLLQFLEANVEGLPEYRNSSTYKAYHSKPYENEEDSPAYFFH